MADYPANFIATSGRMAESCVVHDHPTLQRMAACYTYDKAKAWIMTLLAWFNEQFTTERRLSTFQIESCADLLIQNYPTLKCSELALCLNRILSGRYDDVFYGAVEYIKITAVLNGRFHQERNAMLEAYEQEQQRKRREEESKNAITYEQWQEIKRKKGIKTDAPNFAEIAKQFNVN